METLLIVAIGLTGGIAVGTQGPIAGAMGQRIGGASSSLIVHVGGAIASLLLVLTRRGEQIDQWRSLPWYMLGCGAFGLVLYLSLNHTIPRVGATAAIAMLIVGQLVAGIVIDHFGAFGIATRILDANKIAGVVLLLAGVYLVVR